MHAADDGSSADYTALDEELFGDFSGHEGDDHRLLHNNPHNKNQEPTLPTRHDPDRLSQEATSGVLHLGIAQQATTTSQSESNSQPQVFPPTKSQQHLSPLEFPGTGAVLLGPTFSPSSATTSASTPTLANRNNSTQLITENISWMKARITDVHQLLLHYINLRNSHNDMATNLQKEIMLRSETGEALESIREQQDQTSEDYPRLQFQIAQLKLDVQNERAARIATETSITDINQKLCSYDELFSSMRTRLHEYEEKERSWQKEKELLTARIGGLSDATNRALLAPHP